MKFTTPIDIAPFPFQLTPQSHIVVLGSCFAEHIGQRLAHTLPEEQVCVNPFGVLYHPMVLARALDLLAFPRPLPEDIFFEGKDGLWHSWWHAGAFSAPTHDKCIQLVETSLNKAREVLSKADMLILTLSTDHGYFLKKDLQWGALVANCHKMPSTIFEKKVCALDQMVNMWESLLPYLKEAFPQLRILWTVSPYRYAQYGMHESQLSKARLLLLVDQLIHSRVANTSPEITEKAQRETLLQSLATLANPRFKERYAQQSPISEKISEESVGTQWLFYFPAYEILLDELRDYRFFAPDMLHPSEQAVDYIWEKFTAATFSRELHECSAESASIKQALSHRPLHPDSEEYRRFEAKTQQRIKDFSLKYGFSPR